MNLLNPFITYLDMDEVRFREIAIVVSFFLPSHRDGLSRAGIN